MKYLLFGVFGILGGVLGGMGMGGGTVLIPLLTVFLSVEQKTAQLINLIAFIPMAVVALILHFKNKLVSTKNLWYMIIPACFFGVGGGVLCYFLSSGVMSKIFGWFLLALSFVQFFLGGKRGENADKN